MKRIILLINLLFSFTNVAVIPCNAENEFRLIRLHYTNSTGEKGLTTFEYDINGLMYKALWELADGTRCSINYYSYDKNGNLVKKYREFSDGIISTQFYKYDKDGNLKEESFWRSDSVTGIVIYSYNEAAKLVEADCKGMNGWFYGNIEYKYDNNGNKATAELKNDEGQIGSVSFSYDSNNNLSEEIWTFDSGFRQEFIYEYEKNDKSESPFTSSKVFLNPNKNFRLANEYYEYSGQVSGESVFGYDEGGKLQWSVYYRDDGLKTFSEFFYDSDNKLIKSIRTYSDSKFAIFSYEYDDNRRLIKREFKRSGGIRGVEKYNYNHLGKLVSADWENFDSWLTGTISFEHNTRGHLKSGVFTSQDDYTADIYFTYDKNDNLISITWEFSFGDTQIYNFAYNQVSR